MIKIGAACVFFVHTSHTLVSPPPLLHHGRGVVSCPLKSRLLRLLPYYCIQISPLAISATPRRDAPRPAVPRLALPRLAVLPSDARLPGETDPRLRRRARHLLPDAHGPGDEGERERERGRRGRGNEPGSVGAARASSFVFYFFVVTLFNCFDSVPRLPCPPPRPVSLLSMHHSTRLPRPLDQLTPIGPYRPVLSYRAMHLPPLRTAIR